MRRAEVTYLSKKFVGSVLCGLQEDAFTVVNVGVPLGPGERHRGAD